MAVAPQISNPSMRNAGRDAQAVAQSRTAVRASRKQIDVDLENPRHFAGGRREARPDGRRGDDRVQPEAADRDLERRQRAQRPHRADINGQADLLVRLAKRRLLVRFARVDHAARQRHLAAMPFKRVGAHGQDDMGVGIARTGGAGRAGGAGGEDQQQASGVADARAVEVGRPFTPRPRCEPLVRRRPRQRPLQCRFNSLYRSLKFHKRRVLALRLQPD